MNNTLLIGIVVTGIALLFCIISTAIPYWWRSDNANIGSDWEKATRAMMILSILALGASVLLSIMFGFVMKDKQFLALGSAFMCFAAAGLALLGVIIYGAKIPLDSLDIVYGEGSLHAGFGLAIITVIVAVVAGVFVFLSKNRNE